MSILCPSGRSESRTEESPTTTRRESNPKKSRPRQAIRSLYPSTENLPQIPNAALIFNSTAIVNDMSSQQSESRDSRRYFYDYNYNDIPLNHHHHHDNPVTPYDSTPNPAAEDNNHHDEYQNHNHDFKQSQVEISPNYWVALRGSDETWHALERGFSREIQCPCCSERSLVIADAALALCPECRSIIPIQDHGHGLGLGAKLVHNRRLVDGTPWQQHNGRDPAKMKTSGLREQSQRERGTVETMNQPKNSQSNS